MMATADVDLTLYFRKKHTPPPSVLLLTLPNDTSAKERQRRPSPSIELRSRQQKTRQTAPHIAGAHANNFDVHDTSPSSRYWQRHSDKASQISAAPDVVYRNTYMDDIRREKSAIITGDNRSHLSSPRSPSPRSQHSQQQQPLPRLKTASISSNKTSDSSQRKYHHQYRTVYDYIRDSIRQIERQRNLKQQNFSTRVKRPQNDDSVLRRVLGEKKYSATSGSKNSSTIRTHNGSAGFKNDLQSPQSFVNYINHSREQVRVLHTTTPNHSYHRQRTVLSENQNDSPEKRQSMMMATAIVGNS
jgi:hypothetical protein